MEQYLIITRSMTSAQRMQRLLNQHGIEARLFRAPKTLSEQGCTFAVQISTDDLAKTLSLLHSAKLDPVRVYVAADHSYREASI